MSKRFLIVSLIVIFTLLPAAWVNAQTGSGIPDACRNVQGQSDSVVRIGVPDDAVAGGQGVAGCRVIHNGSGYVLSPAVIGDLGVIRRGVQAAVDVFGVAGGSGVANFGTELQICLRGTGTFVFMNGAFTPKLVSDMPAVTRQIDGTDYTCTFISSAGIAVLVNGPAAPSADVADIRVNEEGVPTVEDTDSTTTDASASPSITVSGSVTPLDGCRVTTTALVRMREEPSTNSGVITRVPFEFTLQATGRTNDWVRVIWQNRQGWISDNYLNFSAGCEN